LDRNDVTLANGHRKQLGDLVNAGEKIFFLSWIYLFVFRISDFVRIPTRFSPFETRTP
jgi:hypothetical protein